MVVLGGGGVSYERGTPVPGHGPQLRGLDVSAVHEEGAFILEYTVR